MSKQVEIKGDTLIVHTRENYEAVKKVIFVHKEKDGRAFYPTDSRYINDLEQIESWTICGYSVSYLVTLAMIFNKTGCNNCDLKDSIDKMFGGDT